MAEEIKSEGNATQEQIDRDLNLEKLNQCVTAYSQIQQLILAWGCAYYGIESMTNIMINEHPDPFTLMKRLNKKTLDLMHEIGIKPGQVIPKAGQEAKDTVQPNGKHYIQDSEVK